MQSDHLRISLDERFSPPPVKRTTRATSVGCERTIHHSALVGHVPRIVGGLRSSERGRDHDAELALFSLRHAFANHHRAVVEPIERWHRGASGGALSRGLGAGSAGFSPRSGAVFGASSSVAAWERTRMQAWEAFEAAVLSGALGVTRVVHEAVFVTAVDLALKMRLDLYGDETPAAHGADATVWVPSRVNDGKRLNAELLLNGYTPVKVFSTLVDKELV